ncbi:alkaline phosphatase family protein [Lysinibacillus odysseyi]|uniref:Phosphodiesterase n=3 Tax=Lysinibacillus odysseyi TaxID=202611 RepID=A0A0A3J798_9BACI|nr:alkaline phosphatase family protein [Lysinibacillus odysseyi]KGR82922.1 phosphodiesterase [Lysinibacillus odysseyi 34hs-1 = NBRC 100172]
MKRKILIAFALVVIVCGVLAFAISMSPTKKLNGATVTETQKPVILVTVDSLMTEPLKKAIKEGKAPAFSFLIKNGQFYPEFISSYPTMSVTIDSTLLTGAYTNRHKVPGLIWFKEDENRMVSYGSGIREMWANGIKNVAADSVIRLNEQHLSKDVQTIHEELAKVKLQSASINGLLYRGSVRQELHVPKLLSFTRLLPKKIEVNGPMLLSLGALSQYNPQNDWNKFSWKRMGVNNDFTVNELKYVMEKQKLPSFTLVYFPDADASIHRNGPEDTKGIEKADQALQELFNQFASWEEAVQKVTWIVLGDSGQSLVKEKKETALIDLNELLKDYTFWENGKENAQLAVAVNERMAYIYLHDEQIPFSEVVDILKKDERIGFVAWNDQQINYVTGPIGKEEFTFSPNGPFTDEYGQSWQLDGDLSILDVKKDQQGIIRYHTYPDALARLHGALHSQEGKVIIVDAKPSYEFIEKHSHDHAGGGAHGSLHRVDSLVPLIITGETAKPPSNRLVDVKGWVLDLVGGS